MGFAIRNGMSATALPAARWHKSRHSNPDGSCLEVAVLDDGEIAVRNSRFPDGPVLVYTPAEVQAFVRGVKEGEFDHLLGHASDAPAPACPEL